jgi:hypothetical protein
MDDHYFRYERRYLCCGSTVEKQSVATAGNVQKQHPQFVANSTQIQMKLMTVNDIVKNMIYINVKLMME